MELNQTMNLELYFNIKRKNNNVHCSSQMIFKAYLQINYEYLL